MNQTHPNATSPPIIRDRDEVNDHQISSIGDSLTEALKSKLNKPELSPEFDLHAGTNEVLKCVGLTTADSGGKLKFYGRDPILQSRLRLAHAGRPLRRCALQRQ